MSETPIPRCCRCAYWERKGETSIGVCVEIVDTVFMADLRPGKATISLRASDRGATSDFMTHADFGCVLHKRRP